MEEIFAAAAAAKSGIKGVLTTKQKQEQKQQQQEQALAATASPRGGSKPPPPVSSLLAKHCVSPTLVVVSGDDDDDDNGEKEGVGMIDSGDETTMAKGENDDDEEQEQQQQQQRTKIVEGFSFYLNVVATNASPRENNNNNNNNNNSNGHPATETIDDNNNNNEKQTTTTTTSRDNKPEVSELDINQSSTILFAPTPPTPLQAIRTLVGSRAADFVHSRMASTNIASAIDVILKHYRHQNNNNNNNNNNSETKKNNPFRDGMKMIEGAVIIKRFRRGPITVLEVFIPRCDLDGAVERVLGDAGSLHYEGIVAGLDGLGLGHVEEEEEEEEKDDDDDSILRRRKGMRNVFETEVGDKVKGALMAKAAQAMADAIRREANILTSGVSGGGKGDGMMMSHDVECVPLDDKEEAGWLFGFLEFVQSMQ